MRRKLPAILLLALLVLVSLSSMFLPDSGAKPAEGARSSEDGGRRGLVLVLREFGFDARRWDERPGTLPTRPGLVWLAELPAASAIESEQQSEDGESDPPEAQAPESDPSELQATEPELAGSQALGSAPLREALLRGLSNPRHYRRFAAQGGAVLVEVLGPEDLSRLAGDFGFFEIDQLELVARQAPSAGESEPACRWISGEALELSAPGAMALSGLESIPQLNVLLEDAERSPLIVEVPIGRGSLVLCTCGAVFDNARIALNDQAVIAVRLAERFSHGAPVRIDESGGLGGNTPTLAEFAFGERALPFTLGAILLALAFLWRSLAAREIPRDPPGTEFMSPRTRALARARLFQRARRFDLVADQLRRGTVRRLGEAARIPPAVCAQALQSDEGARRFAQEIGAGSEVERWIAALGGRAVVDARALTVLDSELCALEDRLGSHGRRVLRRRAAPRKPQTLSN